MIYNILVLCAEDNLKYIELSYVCFIYLFILIIIIIIILINFWIRGRMNKFVSLLPLFSNFRICRMFLSIVSIY